MKVRKTLITTIRNLDVTIAAAALSVLVVLTCMGVVMRYIVGRPFTWLEEVQLFCMVWIVFTAGAAAFRTNSHVAIEMVVEMFPAKVQKIVDIFIDVVVVLVLGYLCYQSIGFVRLFIRSGRATHMLKIPYWFIYGIAPISCIAMIYRYFSQKYFTGRNTERGAENE